MHSYTEENYLKEIFKLMEKQSGEISTNAIAEKLGTKAASVTDMLKKLSDKKLLHYKKYQGVQLSAKGKKVAIEVIRNHRLWEVFLVEKLQFKWDEVHEMAEELEHINSKELVSRLDKFLGYPKFDPHGDPIPDVHGKLGIPKSRILAALELKKSAQVIGVIDHSPAFLQYIEKLGIGIGQTIQLKEIIHYDQSLRISISGRTEAYVSHLVAKNILISA